MNKKIYVFASILCLTFFAGCGALDDTKALTQQANEGVAHGNQLQEAMLEIQFKMLDYMKSTDALMREMNAMTQAMKDQTEAMAKDTAANMALSNEQMKKTLEYMRMQAVATSMAGLVAPENTQYLNPPTKMEPYAASLGEQALTTELIQLAYCLYEDFLYSDASNGQKKIFVYAFSLIGGFMPFEKLTKLVDDEVYAHGRYEETMYALLYGSYESVRDLLFKPAAIDAQVFNVATLKDSVKQFVRMKYVATLPFQSQIRLKVPALLVNRTIDQNEVKSLGQQAANNFNTKLTQTELAKPEVQALIQQFQY